MKQLKNYLSLILILVSILLFKHEINAQISKRGVPKSFKEKNIIPIDGIPYITTPSFDVSSLFKEDHLNKDLSNSLRFAKGFDVSYSINNSGLWENLDNGDKIWRLGIKSPGAFAINILFSEFEIPDSAKIFIFNKKKTYVIGAFTSANNMESKILSTMPVPSDEIIVEYYVPKYVVKHGKLTIGSIGHDYIGITHLCLDPPEGGSCKGNSLSCETDINCTQGASWQNEKHAICRIFFKVGSDYRLCTGALINNTSQNSTPYILTANHCIYNNDIAQTVVALFNYESPSCNGGDGSLNQTISGATLKANYANSDFSLLHLSTSIPLSYNPYFLGWNWSTSNFPQMPVTCIHHPMADVKKISLSDNNKINAFYTTIDYKEVWSVKWLIGTTEEGSSGAPLLDLNHRIIGQLYGSAATCNSSSFFGRLCTSWIGNQTPDSQLKYWLDPSNTGVATLNGTPLLFITGPNIICSNNSGTFTVKNLPSDCSISWSKSANLSLVSNSGNNAIFKASGNGYASVIAQINSLDGSTIKIVKNNISVGSPSISSQTPLAYFDGSTYNNVCNSQNYTTSLLTYGNVSWTRIAANPSNTSWYQSGSDVNFYFYYPNQTAVFRVSASNACGTLSYDFGFQSINCGGGGGGCNTVYNISPNPSKDKIKIIPQIPAPCYAALTNSSKNGFVSVYDQQGTLKKKVKYSYNSEQDVNVSDLKDGIYIIEIYDGNSTDKKTIIVQH